MTEANEPVRRGDGRPGICLCMIVKDEAHVIRRCLASVRPLLDAWCIVDTGSSDGTQAIIREVLSDLPGALHERPWKDFGHNRTEAFALARAWADYALVIDADESLTLEDDFDLPRLTADGYLTPHRGKASGSSFYRLQLLKTTKPWRWVGVVHEVAVCDAPHRRGRLDGLLCVGHFDSARNQLDQREKYTRDARLLEQALIAEPENARHVFYLAQSWRDAGEPDKAIAAYTRRAAMGGWEEEVFYALYQVGLLQLRQGRTCEGVAALLQAYEVRSTRREPLVELARHYREQRQYRLAYLFAKQALGIRRPDDILFLDDTAYAYRAEDEASIAAYWIGAYRESLDWAERVLASPDLPDEQRRRVEQNRAFAARKLGLDGIRREAPQKTVERLIDLIPLAGPIRILDVGASPIDGERPYQSLIDQGLVEVIGFEPDPQALVRLRGGARRSEAYLGHALGDGAQHSLHVCRAPGMTSLLEPDPRALAAFNLFSDFGAVERIEAIDTKRLDDLDGLGPIDFIKLDAQGSEGAIIEHGRRTLAGCLVVHTEAAFFPLYRRQPCLGEIDRMLRGLGFVVHTLFAAKRWGVAPLVIDDNPRRGHNQLIDGDLVYLRDWLDLGSWSDASIAKLIHILHCVYGSFDLGYRLVLELIHRGHLPPGAGEDYLRLAGARPPNQ